MSSILYISNITSAKLNLSFLGSSLCASKNLKYNFHSVANRKGATERQIKEDEKEYGVRLHHIDLDRAPYSLKNIKAYKQLNKLIKEENIDYIHCNTPIGGLLGRLAGKKCNVKKVIYQVHGFHFYKGAPKFNWLIYYPIEKWLARYTDAIITINKEDFDRAKNKLRLRNNGQVYYVPGVGIDLTPFNREKKEELRKSFGIKEDEFVVISAGRLDINKNNETIIRAIAKVSGIHLLICGDGEERENLIKLSNKLGVSDRIHFLGNRTDIVDLYKISNAFIMMSFREGLSRSIMEAMASGLPCIVSEVRGNTDLIDNGKNGFLYHSKDVDGIADGIKKLANNVDLCKRMGDNNIKKVDNYKMSIVVRKMETIYNEIFKGNFNGETDK